MNFRNLDEKHRVFCESMVADNCFCCRSNDIKCKDCPLGSFLPDCELSSKEYLRQLDVMKFKVVDPKYKELCETMIKKDFVCFGLKCKDCPLSLWELEDRPCCSYENKDVIPAFKEYLKQIRKKEIDMKKKIQIIVGKGLAQMKEIDKELVRGGMIWHDRKPRSDQTHLTGTVRNINSYGDGRVTYDSKVTTHYAAIFKIELIRAGRSDSIVEVISAEDFLKNPTIIDGWKEPVKIELKSTLLVNGVEKPISTLSRETWANLYDEAVEVVEVKG